jgi:hypothetical protein
MELLKKASGSSSTITSAGTKADIGSVSIKFSLPANDEKAEVLKKEMEINALLMNEFRYLLQTSLYFGHVFSRVYSTLAQCDSNNIILQSRFKEDNCFTV